VANDRNQKGGRRQSSLARRPNWLSLPRHSWHGVIRHLTYSAWQSQLWPFARPAATAMWCAEQPLVYTARHAIVLGFLTYALLAAVAWNKDATNQWRWAWVISLWIVVQLIFNVDFHIRAQSGLSLLPYFFGIDGGDLHRRNFSAAC
jgi:hypothetical protein